MKRKIRIVLLIVLVVMVLLGACTSPLIIPPDNSAVLPGEEKSTTEEVLPPSNEETSIQDSEILDLPIPVPITEGVSVIKDIEYGKGGDIPLLLDMYIPEKPIATPTPAIIWLHEGGWSVGGKSDEPAISWSTYLAEYGFLVVTLDYRLSGVAQFPAAVQDCKCAVRWLRAHAEILNVNPDQIGVAGGSAGGYLAMMTGLADETAGLEGDGGWIKFSSRVQAICSLYGPSYLPLMYEYSIDRLTKIGEKPDDAAEVQFLGGHLEDRKEVYEAASPINYISSDDPPLLLIHGEIDRIIPFEQSSLMYQAYQQAGLETTLIKVIWAGHGLSQEPNKPISPSYEKNERIVLEFFIKHLAPEK
jgi:acetyl esterase/lipase